MTIYDLNYIKILVGFILPFIIVLIMIYVWFSKKALRDYFGKICIAVNFLLYASYVYICNTLLYMISFYAFGFVRENFNETNKVLTFGIAFLLMLVDENVLLFKGDEK